MKKYALIFSILIFSAAGLSAQKLYVCNSFTERGEPIDAIYKADFDPSAGLSAYALFAFEGSKPRSDLLYLFIDKIIDGKPAPFDSRSMQINSRKNWIAENYDFKESGSYVLYVADSFGSRLASSRVILNEKKSERDNPSADALYYSNSEIIFCQMVQAGRPLREFKALNMDDRDRTIAVMLNNKKPLKTGKLMVVVWMKNDNTVDYDVFVSSRKFMVQRDWDDTYFNYTFRKPGEYKFSLYDENEKLIKSAFFTVYK